MTASPVLSSGEMRWAGSPLSIIVASVAARASSLCVPGAKAVGPFAFVRCDQWKEGVGERAAACPARRERPRRLEERRRVAVPGLVYSTTGEGADEAEVEQRDAPSIARLSPEAAGP